MLTGPIIDRIELRSELLSLEKEGLVAKGLQGKAGMVAFAKEKASLQKAMVGFLLTEAEEGSTLLDGIMLEKIPPTKKEARGYRAAFRARPKDQGDVPPMLLRVGFNGGASGAQHSLKAEWNPARTGEWGSKYLQLLCELAATESGSPMKAAASCVVGRVDIAFDLPGVPPRTLGFDHNTKHEGLLHRRKKRGLEGLHFGAKGCDGVHIYDRRYAEHPSEALRIEFRVMPTWPKLLKLPDLPNLPNPLHRLMVYDTRCLPLPKPHRAHLARAICAEGLEIALTDWDEESVRSLHREKLLSNPPAWWNPDALWTGWPAVAAKLLYLPPSCIPLAA